MYTTSRSTRRLVAAATLCVASLGFAQAATAADLRNPRLESSCETDYAYGEVSIGPFRVEGCNKRGTAQDGESARFLFKGNLEVNGLLVEPSSGSDPVIGKIKTAPDRNNRLVTNGELDRSQNTRLVLDPRIGGERRRIVINNGPLHLDGSGTSLAGRPANYVPMAGGDYEIDGGALGSRSIEAAPEIGGGAPPAAAQQPVPANQGNGDVQPLDLGVATGSTSLPVGGTPALLGLRLFDLEDVTLYDDGMRFEAELKLGSGAPGLMRDVVGSATIELDDGTGMRVSDLKFKIGHIGIPGVGGMDRFRVNYDSGRDEWSGGFELDLGDLFPGMDFSAKVNASTGVPTAMNLEVEPLNIAVGPGIFLQGLRGGFDTSPLSFTAGATITAGPQIAGWSILTADGDVSIALEPNFRFEASGRVRVFPTGQNSEIARGDVEFIYDSSGLISLSGDARFEATALGFGISATIGGSGQVSTTNNVFNIGAHATGNLELGFLGSVRIVELRAVVSSDGFGTCGELFSFISTGIGQEWRNGGLRMLNGCDLGPFRVNVANASRAQRLRQNAGKVTPFVIRGEQKKALVEVRGAQGGIPMRVIGPDGNVVAQVAAGERKVEGDVAVINSAAGYVPQGTGRGPVTLIGLRNPKPGRYVIQTPANAPAIAEVGVATDPKPLRVQLQTGRTGKTGERRMRARAQGLESGDLLQYGFRTQNGVEPIGAPVGANADLKFLEQARPGRRQIVAQLVRNGIPVPGRATVVGVHTAALPEVGDEVVVQRKGQRLQVRALPKAGTDRPSGFEYRITQNGKTGVFKRAVGKSLKVWLPKSTGQATIAVHPVFRGVAIERVRKVVRVR